MSDVYKLFNDYDLSQVELFELREWLQTTEGQTQLIDTARSVIDDLIRAEYMELD